jgi:hypothetical protein
VGQRDPDSGYRQSQGETLGKLTFRAAREEGIPRALRILTRSPLRLRSASLERRMLGLAERHLDKISRRASRDVIAPIASVARAITYGFPRKRAEPRRATSGAALRRVG